MFKKENGNGIPGIQQGWFSEMEAMWPGQKFSLALEVRLVGLMSPCGERQMRHYIIICSQFDLTLSIPPRYAGRSFRCRNLSSFTKIPAFKRY